MFKIKKRNKRQSEQDPAFPMQCTRAFLYILRHAHSWQQLLLGAYRAMPPEWQPSYKAYAELQLRPTFDEVIQLIEGTRQQGFITDDEAASLNAGKPIECTFRDSTAAISSSTEVVEIHNGYA